MTIWDWQPFLKITWSFQVQITLQPRFRHLRFKFLCGDSFVKIPKCPRSSNSNFGQKMFFSLGRASAALQPLPTRSGDPLKHRVPSAKWRMERNNLLFIIMEAHENIVPDVECSKHKQQSQYRTNINSSLLTLFDRDRANLIFVTMLPKADALWKFNICFGRRRNHKQSIKTLQFSLCPTYTCILHVLCACACMYKPLSGHSLTAFLLNIYGV